MTTHRLPASGINARAAHGLSRDMDGGYNELLKQIISFAIEGDGSPSTKMWLLERFARAAIPEWEKILRGIYRAEKIDRFHVEGEMMPQVAEIISSFWLKFQKNVVDEPGDSLLRAFQNSQEQYFIVAMLKNHVRDELDKFNVRIRRSAKEPFEEYERDGLKTPDETEKEALDGIYVSEMRDIFKKYKETNADNWLILYMVYHENMRPNELNRLFEGNIYYRIRKAEKEFGEFVRSRYGE